MNFSEQEIELGEKIVLKFEKRARNWRRDHVLCIIIGLLSLTIGIFMCIDGLRTRLEPYEEQIERYIVESEQIPSGTERDLWIVGTFRKAASILETRFKLYQLTVLSNVVGIFLAFGGLFPITFAIKGWNRKPEQQLIAKVLRTKWNEKSF